ncbi:DNA-dependent protein kinase catalytic subunit, partial [Biomphalaria glabrata]
DVVTKTSQSSRLSDSMDVDEPETQDNQFEKVQTYQLIKKFTKEVLVRMKQYRDELLAACLSLTLALPEEIIQDQMANIVPAIQTTFIMGLSYLPLANIGLDALQYWSDNLPASLIEPYYAEIMPYLDAYLRTDDKGSDMTVEPAMLVPSKKAEVKSKVSVRLIKGKPAADQNSETQLTSLKLRILQYLGSLGGQHISHALLAKSDEEISSAAIAWDTQKHLKFDVPFIDMKPSIYLDPFLPQVVKLAKQSSDRQTKVAACELLHSLVLYALGRGAQMPGETQKKYPMEQLYRKLFPSLLQLACDVELVCKELFEPLMLQLIHWFTNNKMAESPETMALLDCIFDGLIQSNDMALRDFCAKCLREFLKWSLKQISKKSAEKNPINVKSVLKRIYSFSSHPNASKRLGAALAFNNIYMVLREEDALVDRFTFEILVHFVDSLSLAHYDEKSLGTQEQCVKALEHLERIMKTKVDILKKDPGPKIRPEPSSWNSRKLEFAVRWLTRQCGNPQTECRHSCMKLVYNLCVLLPGIKTPSAFFAILHKSEGPIYFLRRFEGGGQGYSESHGILAHPTMIEYRKTFSLEVAREWFDLLLAALDCYCWLFGQELMIPSQIFKGKESERSCIFVSLEFFLKRLAFNDIAAASRLFSHRDNFTFTPREIEEYNRMKCTVIIRFWNFMSILIAKFSKELKEIVPSSLWCYQLWRLLCYCVIKPSTLGFNMSDTEIMLNLPKEMNSCLQTLSKFLPSDILIQFKNALKQELSGECDLVTMLPINLMSPATNYTHLSLMLEGYRQLHTAGLLIDHLPKLDTSDKQCLAVQLLNNVFQGIVDHQDGELSLVTLTPSALSLAKTLLTLSLELDVPISDLVEKLLDKTQVQGLSGGVKVNHGDHFLTLMSSTIAGSVVGKVPEILEMFVKKTSMLDTTCVGALLVAVLDHVAKDRMLRKNVGVKLCQAILGFLNQQKSCLEGESSADNQRLLLLILTKLFLIDGQIAKDSSSETFQSLSDMYQCILKDPKINMAIKNEALVLLPFFVTAKSQQDKYLKETLDRFIVDNFPLTSTELEPGTSKYKDYITAIDRILVAMEMTGSLMLLNIVISVYCRETEHIHSEAIQLGINRFVQRLPLDQQLLAMDIPFSVFVNDNSYLPHVRRAAVENVCLPILRVVSTSALVQFFSSHIQEIIRYLDQTLSKNVESALENQLSTKIGCFQVLEIMYARLSKEEVNSQTSVINQKLCEGKVDTGKEMTQKITKCAHEARSEDVRGETLLPDLRRQYHCFAYNLLIAIISCVQTDLKFYKGFLFQDNISKGQFLLENIVDTNKKYEFTVEVKSPVQRHKKFVSIRNIAHEMRAESNGQDESASPSLHLASQYLADSSLNDDLNQFDFNMSSNWQSELYDPITTSDRSTKGGHSTSQENKVTTEEPSSQDYIELEMDALNRHESMASLIAVIKHMSIAKITPEVSPGNLPTEMPSWMSYLHEKMSAAFSAVNVRLFICKLVMNCSQIFQPYAKFWLKPFGQLLLEKTVCGEGLTYFAVDIIITMITWHKSAIPADTTDERALASRIVRLVSDNIYHPVRQIYRNNLTLLKSLLEVWHDRVDIPYDTIYNLLKNTDPKSMKSTTGIQILGVVLAGKFPPYGPVAPVDRDRYLSSLCVLMSNCYKAVHAAAAEVIGLAMKWLEKNCKETEGPFHDSAIAQLTSLSNNNLGIFITCLHCIHLSYPPLCFKFQSKLLYILPKLHGHFKVQCLELLLGQVYEMENVYLQLKGLSEYLIHRSEDVQLVALKIVHAVMTRLKGSELLSFLKVGTTFSGHPNPACRKIMLEIFMWSYDNYRDMEDEDSAPIMSVTKEALLRGLCDEDFACRLVCLNFWSSNTRLPEGTLERTISMLEAMYSPNTEPHYLAYATNLLLEATSKSPDYQREIFEHALSECTFQDYSVHSSWRQRHAVMTPLFASTFVTQSMETGQDSLDGGLRATQDMPQFTPTMDMTGTARAFNWLTQSSLDTYADPGSSVGASSQLLFNVGSSSQHRNLLIPGQKGEATAKKTFAWKKITLNNIKPAANKDETDGSVQSHEDIWRLRRRFVKDQQAQSLFYIRRNVKINTLREEILKEQKARRENQVTLYRKYRIGDLPDIQIKYQYIIAPLQALAHRDSTVARLLFSSLFQAIFCEMDKLKTETEIKQLVQHINDSISHILRESLYYFPPFLGSILTILYELRSSLKVSASDVGTSSITSNQQSLGIMVLEENLIKSDSTEVAHRSKKSRQTRSLPSPELAEWIQLSRLYKSANEFDIVQGIFSDQLGTKDQTRKAIEAEARGDFKTANLIYSQIIAQQDWKDGDPLEAEVDFWDISRMECLDHLSQWKDLETISVKGVDSSDQPNLDRVWDDGFYQEQYLPYVIRSKLKLLLSGDANQQSLLTFVDNCMTDLQKKQHLENRYCSELALMSLWQQSYDRSRHYCNMAFRGFLQDWCNTTTLMVSSCRKNLQQLQSLVELKEFLDSVGPDHKVLPSASTLLINAWKGRLPHKLLDPVPVWDDITHNRIAYINLILDQLSDMNINHTITELHKAMASLRLAMADCCQTQNNYTLTLRLLRDTQTVCKNSDQELFLRWSHLYTAAHQSSAKSKGHPWTDDIFSNIATTLELLKKLEEYAILLERSDLRLEHQILTGEGYGLLAQGVLKFDYLPDLEQGTLKKCYSLATPEGMEVSKDKMFCQLVDKGYNYLKAAVCQDMDDQLNEKKRQAITMEEANLRLAKFCDKYLILGDEMERFPKECDRTLFPETIVLCLLNAMKGGSEEARERFPRLLQLSELFPDVRDVFIKKAAEVPSWMFLMWTSQMTALMDKDESVVVSPLLERIAEDYPQALIYPLHMSSEGFDFIPKSESKIEKYQLNRRKETVDRLNSKIHNVLVYKFISALEQFGQPDIIFKDWCTDMKRLLGKDKSSKDEVRRKCQEIYDQLLNVKGDTTASSTQINYSATAASVGMGEFRKGFSDNFKAEFEKVFGKDGCKLISMNAKDFQGAEACLRNLIDGKKGLFNPPTKLKAYSPWLAEFNPNKFGKDLEIPGQYTGQQKPTPEYHVKIAGFDERVLVMSSLRKPKRILIRGNDEQDYPYLVKSGEDLRLDQRIEMLFFMMNKVMNSDWACKQRKLQLKTYQVVSMTPRVGLIEWMRDTCPLKNFLYNALTEEERKFLDSERGPSKVYNQWICKLVNKAQYGHWQKIFDEVYIKYNYTETIKQFRLLEGTVPWDLSRRALHSMSSSPEAFHVLKSAMIKSHAVICICQYLLGIGDRHLSNFMVDLKTGQLIGIDFGHAFGSATEFLPVPELMPFRLTRQLINLSLPLKVKGQMESTMRHVLRALRADSDLLLRTMDVFVKEPHLDWLNFAERQKDESADAECENTWYPEKKIIIARRKLKGDHPSYIMMQELESVKAKREKVYTYICGVLKGQKDENVRFSFQAHDLTVEEQVAALIDQATDPNILGRTWTGWEPWF